ncbi:MAG: hypothetical protein NVSMB9_37040 [Isosphaeraceae bacterium]
MANAPSQFMKMDPKVFFLGVFCLVLIFVVASLKATWLKIVPPQVIAAVIGLIIGQFPGLKGEHLINIPADPITLVSRKCLNDQDSHRRMIPIIRNILEWRHRVDSNAF